MFLCFSPVLSMLVNLESMSGQQSHHQNQPRSLLTVLIVFLFLAAAFYIPRLGHIMTSKDLPMLGQFRNFLFHLFCQHTIFFFPSTKILAFPPSFFHKITFNFRFSEQNVPRDHGCPLKSLGPFIHSLYVNIIFLY